jgi:hypothetical protein
MGKIVFMSLLVVMFACGFFSGAYYALHHSRELRCEIDGTVALERVVNSLSVVRDSCLRTENACVGVLPVRGVSNVRKR